MKYKAVNFHDLPKEVNLIEAPSELPEQQPPTKIRLVLLLYCARCGNEHEPFECPRYLPL